MSKRRLFLAIFIIPVAGAQPPDVTDRPELLASNVVNAANYAAGIVTPGEVAILYARNAGPVHLAESHLDSTGKLATEVGDTRVFFDDIPAPVFYSVRGQIGVVVPYEISGRRTTSILIEYEDVRSIPVEIPVVAAAPTLFTLDLSGTGQAAMLNQAGCCNSPRSPAMLGSYVQLYATGVGQTNPPGIDGFFSDYPRLADYPVPQLPVKVTVGGVPAQILYAGEAPLHVSGNFVVNFRVPTNAPVGDAVPLTLTIGDFRSPQGITMATRSPVERVLIVDHDPATRQSLVKMFQDAGYAALAAPDAEHALSSAQERRPDLMICEGIAIGRGPRNSTKEPGHETHRHSRAAHIGNSKSRRSGRRAGGIEKTPSSREPSRAQPPVARGASISLNCVRLRLRRCCRRCSLPPRPICAAR